MAHSPAGHPLLILPAEDFKALFFANPLKNLFSILGNTQICFLAKTKITISILLSACFTDNSLCINFIDIFIQIKQL